MKNVRVTVAFFCRVATHLAVTDEATYQFSGHALYIEFQYISILERLVENFRYHILQKNVVYITAKEV